jgi:hypothetical protein
MAGLGRIWSDKLLVSWPARVTGARTFLSALAPFILIVIVILILAGRIGLIRSDPV